LGNRYTRSGEVEDLARAIAVFERAAKLGLEIATNVSLTSARNWLVWAFSRDAWGEVVQAYEYAYQASTRLVQIQSTRQHQELWLKDSQGLAAHAAYALAKESQLEKAVVTLERGLARLLSEALARDWADLVHLKQVGRGDLYDRYHQAVNDWHNAQYIEAEDIYPFLRAARQALEDTIKYIRQVEGYADFMMPPNFKDIMAAVNNSALVYLAVTRAGGLALIVFEDGAIMPVWLPDLTEDSLEHTLNDMEPPGTFYLRAYHDWRRRPHEEDRQQWLARLDSTTYLLWQQVMAPLIEVLPKSMPISLIPVGRLGLFPFHAAWTEDEEAPTGKRYALDELTIRYAPNARSLAQANKVARRVAVDYILAVDEPKPVTNDNGEALPLPSAKYEVQRVVANFSKNKIFRHEEATRQAILDYLPVCDILHCSCHGVADLQKPLKSGLIMTGNERLTVEDLLNLRLNGIRLVTLSACETGIPGLELPDEVVGLPAGLLQAGVAGVVASLWSVSDRSTALLMTKFYQLWREGTRASIAPALQAAQCWLRDATKEELAIYVEHLSLDGEQWVQFMLFFNTISAGERPFSSPFYWAAFCAIGQ
jgi:CHAT domain-containing protein